MKTYRVVNYNDNIAYPSPPSAALVAASLATDMGATYAECVDGEWRPLDARDFDSAKRYGRVVATVYVEEV